jgi:hypothetical protein
MTVTPGDQARKTLQHADPDFAKAIENLRQQMGTPKPWAPEPGKETPMGKGTQVDFPGGAEAPWEKANLHLSSADDMNYVTVELPGGAMAELTEDTDPSKLPPGSKIQDKAAFDLTTNEGRAEWRMKLAQKGLEYSDMIGRAHPKGGHQPGGFDTKPSDNLGYVETIEEVKEKAMQLAKLEPKARKQAEKIQELVASGRLDPADVDQLTTFAKVDPAAVQYWKQYYGQAGDAESKEFAAKLVAEHANEKMAAEIEKREVKIARAYDLAYEMRARGMIEDSQVKSQVAEILKWNDAAFDSSKRMVMKLAIKKQASVPQVGLLHSEDVYLPAAEPTAEQQSLADIFAGHFAGRRY